ncbi:MAG: family 20 glycosylhydrolase [Bacteroidetes bacterium]|nr:family 20 glycosylhydrolase [Bacteroidota bacterium]MBS1973668.1 family 20 glycosylhydrolase [Bacteroidota bacterium]
MKKYLLALVFLTASAVGFEQEAFPVIPLPNSIETKTGRFVFTNCTQLHYNITDTDVRNAVMPLIEKLRLVAGITLYQKPKCKTPSMVEIAIDKSIVNDEGYVLSVSPQKILLKAKTTAGIFYGAQTLLQLLPDAIEKGSFQKNISWSIPCVVIKDEPRFSYRGIMLDVARHYMPMAFLKKLIDLLAMQKMNRLHLHLTDSQGWRFECKKYPKLTEIGAYRKGTPLNTTYDYNSRPNDTLYGGYYTQEQLKELVRYASAHFITIVPEIEMPAHSMSALASYPELACLDSNGNAFPYPQQIQNEYCTKDETFTFLDNVLSEVMDVFPSKYIHIAGDEASKENWAHCRFDQQRMKEEGLKNVDELQSYFIKRIEKFVNSRGRSVIGWDEILQGGLAPNATVMSWTGIEGGITAAEQHHNVIMTPAEYCYFNFYQSGSPGEPVAFCCMLTLPKVYSYDPIPDVLKPDERRYVLGTQGNLWTEYVPTYQNAEYMIFPRAVALAEVGWTNTALKQYEGFRTRLIKYLKRLDDHHVNYSRHLFEIKLTTSLNEEKQVTASLAGVDKEYAIRYTLDGTGPTDRSPVYAQPVIIEKNATMTAAVLQDGIVLAQLKKDFRLHKAVGKAAVLATPPDEKYNTGGNNAWVNGCLGNDEQFSDDEWLGWNGKEFNGTIDFGNATVTSSLQTRFFHKPNSWIWAAKKVTAQVSDDGKIFRTVAEKEVPVPSNDGAVPFSMSWQPVTARYMRIIAGPVEKIPAGNPGAGNGAWLFVDEMVVN